MRTLTLLTSLAVGASAGTVSAPLAKQRFQTDSLIHKRDTLGLAALNNVTGGGYYAEFQIGTPGQNISFQLDTGSSDTWVNSDDTDLCNSKRLQETSGFCTSTFNPDKSRTFKMVDRDGFDIAYLDTRKISGDYFDDTVTIDGKSIKQQRLGMATKSVRPTGIMGLGFSSNVASVVSNGTYPTIVDNMVSQGLIDRAAFSLWLNDLDSEQGTILFGGIDTKKFYGKLATLSLLPDSGAKNITHFRVPLEGLEAKAPKGKDEVKLGSLKKDTTAILDSGATVCLLPETQAEAIYKAFGVLSVKEVSMPFVDCAYAGNKGKGYTLDFKFDGKTISVPLSEMVINAFPDKQEIFNDPLVSSYFDKWDSVCMFGISPGSQYGMQSSMALLGDTFLRSAYVVYDLANEQVGIAEAVHNANDSSIVELKKKDTKLPDVSGVEGKLSTGSCLLPVHI
ncbi:hypothetical protein F53441_2750 [Fusarium austroafricanum]|uniref:Peptidase A1 domain-containing protein n=1 Tax=Fusarium austroafricanum TaxID=2364996 RepID=A0A8H4KSA9_9HYPO|nr:hypothetical protein F53441_2750 [Fusarium austroafricanum]